MNLYIIGGLVVQSLVSKVNGLAGAIVGYIVTTGILIWGLTLYSQGHGIAFFSIGLSLPVFVIACLVWYGFDTFELVKALNGEEDNEGPFESAISEDSNAITRSDNETESVPPQTLVSQSSLEGGSETTVQPGATTISCPNCGERMPRFASNCGKCGTSLA